MMQSKKNLFLYLYLLVFKVYVEANDVGNANDYIDQVLKNLRNEPSVVAEIDPVKIPDFSEKGIQGSNGIVRGLSSLYRHGDCTVTYENNVATVSGEIGVRDVSVSMDYKAKALFFWIKGHVEGRLDHLAVKMVLQAKDGKARLESFKVLNLGNYKITKITGMSVVLNWMLKLIANSIAKKSRGKIINALENEVPKALNNIFAKVEIPL